MRAKKLAESFSRSSQVEAWAEDLAASDRAWVQDSEEVPSVEPRDSNLVLEAFHLHSLQEEPLVEDSQVAFHPHQGLEASSEDLQDLQDDPEESSVADPHQEHSLEDHPQDSQVQDQEDSLVADPLVDPLAAQPSEVADSSAEEVLLEELLSAEGSADQAHPSAAASSVAPDQYHPVSSEVDPPESQLAHPSEVASSAEAQLAAALSAEVV